jgi:hypothetical protein
MTYHGRDPSQYWRWWALSAASWLLLAAYFAVAWTAYARAEQMPMSPADARWLWAMELATLMAIAAAAGGIAVDVWTRIGRR